MSENYDTYDCEANSIRSPMETEFASWKQSGDPCAPGPMRDLPQTHTYWQSQGTAHLMRSSSHPNPMRFHRRIQKKQCSYDLHEDFMHHAPTEQGGFDNDSVSDVPSSPISSLSYSTSSSRTSRSTVPSTLFSETEIQRRPSDFGSHHSTDGIHAHASPITPLSSQSKRQNARAKVSKKKISRPLLRTQSKSTPYQ